MLSISKRSGLGYAGVLAEFRLSERSCVWTASCELHIVFLCGNGRQNYRIYFHEGFIFCRLSLTIKHAVPLKEVVVYAFMESVLVL